MSLAAAIPRRYKLAIKARLLRARAVWVRTLLSYDAPRLQAALRSLGVRRGDSLMLHSAFGAHHGFRGSVDALIDAFIDSIGPDGNLLMVSLPYRSSSLQYLEQGKTFDVRRTPSMMGLVSEFFRRRPDVLRSLHPTHPILAHGPKARWLIAEHERCVHPCGPGTPFDKALEIDAKALFFNVPFGTLTFFHYLEHLVHARLPFALYTAEPIEVPVIDHAGRPRRVRTHVYAPEAIARRRFELFESAMRERRLIREKRIGNTRILAVRLRDAVDCVLDMARDGRYFYDLSPLAAPAPSPP